MSDNENYEFPTTQWTGVERAGHPNTLGRLALGELLSRYLAPMRAHLVLSRRLPPDQAEDHLQAFISDRVLEQDLVTNANRERGKFRTFLLVALNRFVSNAQRDAKRQCRSPRQGAGMEDAADVADQTPTPADAFETAWAREVIVQAAQQMREACLGSGRADLWRTFEGRILLPTIEGAEPTPYEQLMAELRLTSVHAASNLMITGKRMFARSLRGVVGEYTAEVEQELADLRAILARRR